MSTGRPVRVGLIGLGSMGRNHLRVLGEHSDVVLAAVADPDATALADAVATTGAPGFADPAALIASGRLDAVVIAAPTMSHAGLALAAIDRSIPVLVEKPLAATVDEARAIISASRARNVPVQVGHIERFNPAVLQMGRLIADGWLSSVYAIASRRAGPFPGRIRDVGVAVDLATHDVDILCSIAGERPRRVYAELAQRIHTSHEDLLFGLMHFPSGTTGMIDVNWLTPAKRRQLVVTGEEGMFELDYLTQRLTFTRSDLGRPVLIRGYAVTFAGDVAEVSVDVHEPLKAELDAFLDVVRTGSRPLVDAEDGAWAVAIATAMLDAAGNGESVAPADPSAVLATGPA